MAAKAKTVPNLKMKFKRDKCSVCEAPGPVLFCIPVNEDRYKKWFSALNWNVPPDQIKYVLKNAKVCGQHFSESCFASTLRNKLLKFACPQIRQDLPPIARVTLSALPSTKPECKSVEGYHIKSECSKNVKTSSVTSFCDVNGHLQVQQHGLEIQKSSPSENKI